MLIHVTLTSNDKLAYINSMERIIFDDKTNEKLVYMDVFLNLSYDHRWTNWERNHIYLIFKSNYLIPFLNFLIITYYPNDHLTTFPHPPTCTLKKTN